MKPIYPCLLVILLISIYLTGCKKEDETPHQATVTETLIGSWRSKEMHFIFGYSTECAFSNPPRTDTINTLTKIQIDPDLHYTLNKSVIYVGNNTWTAPSPGNDTLPGSISNFNDTVKGLLTDTLINIFTEVQTYNGNNYHYPDTALLIGDNKLILLQTRREGLKCIPSGADQYNRFVYYFDKVE